MVRSFAIAALVLAGCRKPPEAPRALDALASFLFAVQAEEDDATIAVAVDNLLVHLEKLDLTSNSPGDRTWELSPPSRADVSGIERPDGDPAATLGLAIARESRWPVRDHARLQTEADQTPAERTAAWYDRRFPTTPDPSCFIDATCPALPTMNEVERHNLLFSVSGPFHMDFRWVEHDELDVFVGRGWIPEPWPSDGQAAVWQSYRTGAWIGRGPQTWRFDAIWTETEVPGVSDAMLMASSRGGAEDQLKDVDDAIGALYHGE